ncbi:ammonium transporter [Demequina muriae]|uniref:Ammonium transporter n=1 Tax=Demequina muriae TaxID=3051664 RepID=A0ABT8GDY0_9MICO|nr:ammonium transporter [Demequina sp. EGI L300058]MDN4479635.1 ammonium transporter [Demequina sp. EGI L300058]
MDSPNVAWLLTSASLVLLMTPGLALFYGGMSRRKSVLNMMMMSFSAIGVVGVLWVIVGYSVSAGDTVGGWFGNPASDFGMQSIFQSGVDEAEGTEADLILAAFGATFAIITVALISGAVADRMKFSAWLVFAALWAVIVYSPVSHWVWGGGLLSSDYLFSDLTAPQDIAGGTVVHINAGVAALVLVLLLGKRKGFGKEPMRPHNLTLVMLGAALLWFGWFGFNAGSWWEADVFAAQIWLNTLVATAAGMLGWLLLEKLRDGKATSLGSASGVVAGLVAITPAGLSVSPLGAITLGFIAGILSALAVGLKYKLGYDDSLDVVGVHLVAGLWGTVAVGLFATDVNAFGDAGLFYGGGASLLVSQIIAAVVVMAYSAIATLIIGLAIKFTIGLRVSDEDEVAGIDFAEHGETAYEEAI